MSQTIIYTDGSSRGNPGPGGWAAILIRDDSVKEIGGREVHTTNNRMEMMAVISAIREIKIGEPATINTDSSYVLKGSTEWLGGWKRNNWKTSQKKDVENQDLWQEMDSEVVKHQIEWVWVKGHAGNHFNEIVDELARSAAEKNR